MIWITLQTRVSFYAFRQNSREICAKSLDQTLHVCIDSTHGKNMYDFKVVTILVVDEYGEGIPVGWMVTERIP